MLEKVSVILPTYNRASVLHRSISSVLGQSFQDFKLYIVDDGSTDQTHQVLQGWLKDPRVHKISLPENRGVSFARNRGIEASQGDWVAFLDSDDEWLENKLEDQWEAQKQSPEIPLVHGDEIWIRNGTRVNPMKKHKKEGGDIFANSLKLCCVSPSTALLRRSLFSEVGLFREDFPVCEDYDLWLKISARYKVTYVDRPLIKKYGGHEDQLSRRFRAMDYWRILSIADLMGSGVLNREQREAARKELQSKAKILLKGYRKHENLGDYDSIFSILSRSLVEA